MFGILHTAILLRMKLCRTFYWYFRELLYVCLCESIYAAVPLPAVAGGGVGAHMIGSFESY